MREKNLNFDKQKIYKFFQDKKYVKISKISKSILKAFANDKETVSYTHLRAHET